MGVSLCIEYSSPKEDKQDQTSTSCLQRCWTYLRLCSICLFPWHSTDGHIPLCRQQPPRQLARQRSRLRLRWQWSLLTIFVVPKCWEKSLCDVLMIYWYCMLGIFAVLTPLKARTCATWKYSSKWRRKTQLAPRGILGRKLDEFTSIKYCIFNLPDWSFAEWEHWPQPCDQRNLSNWNTSCIEVFHFVPTHLIFQNRVTS